MQVSHRVPAMVQAVNLSQQRPGFDPGPIHVRFLLQDWHWNRFFSGYFGFPSSVLFYQCSILSS